jgi:hypothetical protein
LFISISGRKNITQSQEVPKERKDRALATQEAEKKTAEIQNPVKEQGKEVIQVPPMQQGSEESIPYTQW